MNLPTETGLNKTRPTGSTTVQFSAATDATRRALEKIWNGEVGSVFNEAYQNIAQAVAGFAQAENLDALANRKSMLRKMFSRLDELVHLYEIEIIIKAVCPYLVWRDRDSDGQDTFFIQRVGDITTYECRMYHSVRRQFHQIKFYQALVNQYNALGAGKTEQAKAASKTLARLKANHIRDVTALAGQLSAEIDALMDELEDTKDIACITLLVGSENYPGTISLKLDELYQHVLIEGLVECVRAEGVGDSYDDLKAIIGKIANITDGVRAAKKIGTADLSWEEISAKLAFRCKVLQDTSQDIAKTQKAKLKKAACARITRSQSVEAKQGPSQPGGTVSGSYVGSGFFGGVAEGVEPAQAEPPQFQCDG